MRYVIQSLKWLGTKVDGEDDITGFYIEFNNEEEAFKVYRKLCWEDEQDYNTYIYTESNKKINNILDKNKLVNIGSFKRDLTTLEHISDDKANKLMLSADMFFNLPSYEEYLAEGGYKSKGEEYERS